MTSSAQLDAEELLHLGLHATQNDDPANAMELLKRSLALQPDNGKATYLLGALYAQVGMYDRAKEAMQRAVELDTSLTTASFQLGLLHLTSGDIDKARAAWDRLDSLAPEHSFNCFRIGLLALVEDRFDACAELLQQGIDNNDFNDALNADMQRVRQSALAASGGGGATSATPLSTLPQPTKALHVLGSYRSRS